MIRQTAIAKAIVACVEGQPQKTPPRRKPNSKPWLESKAEEAVWDPIVRKPPENGGGSCQ